MTLSEVNNDSNDGRSSVQSNQRLRRISIVVINCVCSASTSLRIPTAGCLANWTAGLTR